MNSTHKFPNTYTPTPHTENHTTRVHTPHLRTPVECTNLLPQHTQNFPLTAHSHTHATHSHVPTDFLGFTGTHTNPRPCSPCNPTLTLFFPSSPALGPSPRATRLEVAPPSGRAGGDTAVPGDPVPHLHGPTNFLSSPPVACTNRSIPRIPRYVPDHPHSTFLRTRDWTVGRGRVL